MALHVVSKDAAPYMRRLHAVRNLRLKMAMQLAQRRHTLHDFGKVMNADTSQKFPSLTTSSWKGYKSHQTWRG